MDDKKRTARYWIAFFILAVFLVILFVWNVNAGSIHLSVGEILNIISDIRRCDCLQYNMGNPSSQDSVSDHSWRSTFCIRISSSDIF